MRTVRLVSIEIKRLAREPMTLLLYLMPLIMAPLLGRVLWPLASSLLMQYLSFDLAPYFPLLCMAILQMAPASLGIGAGFLILDDRDSGLLAPLSAAPGGIGGFLLRRIAVATVLCFLECLAIPFLLVDGSVQALNVFHIGLVALFTAPLAGMYGFLLGALARNKVEGMSIAKVLSLLDFGPLLVFFVPMPWLWLCSIIPTVPSAHVAMEAFAWQGRSLGVLWPIVSLVLSLGIILACYKICLRRAEAAGGL